MPAFLGSTARQVHIDANAVTGHVREIALYNPGMRGTGRRAGALRMHLGQTRHAVVAETAGMEAMRNLEKDLAQKLGWADYNVVKRPALKFLREYLGNAQVADQVDHVSAVRDMYSLISGDPHSQKFSKWKKKARL